MAKQNNRRSLIGFHKDKGEYWFNNQKIFAEDFDLTQGRISDCALKKSKKHKEWTFSDPTEEDRAIIDWWLNTEQSYKHIANKFKIIDLFFEHQKNKTKKKWESL